MKSVVLTGDEMILTTQTTTQKVWFPIGKTVVIEVSNKRDTRCIYGFLNVRDGQEHAFKTDYTKSMTTRNILNKLIEFYPDKKILNKFYLIAFSPYAPLASRTCESNP